ncbi:integrin alpha-8-like [Branchiostoma lanceolatum]|uniref:integrin alpha-8-like n=1 Tax=Branchiostoma lanceolatum TaxID=7740 RepID=UPI0034540A1A
MLCVEYGGHGVPDTQDFLVDVVLDGPLLPLQRAVLKQDKSELAMSLLKRQTSCLMLDVHLKPISGQLFPVLRPDAETHLSTHVNMSRNCGLDDVCVPDLTVQAHGSTTTIYVGDTTSIVLDITVSNRGEESYESQLFVLVPEEVDYVGAQRMGTNTPAMCSYTAAGTGGTIKCGLGNPLKADATVVLQLRFLAANLNGSRSFLDFPVFANSSTPDDMSTTGDNQVVFSAQVVVEADVTVKGASLPRDMWLDNTFVRGEESVKGRPDDNLDTDVEAEPVISQIKHVYEMCGNVGDCYTISCIVNELRSGDGFVLDITSEIEDVQLSSVGNTTQDRFVSSVRVVVMDMPYRISPTALPTAGTNIATPSSSAM